MKRSIGEDRGAVYRVSYVELGLAGASPARAGRRLRALLRSERGRGLSTIGVHYAMRPLLDPAEMRQYLNAMKEAQDIIWVLVKNKDLSIVLGHNDVQIIAASVEKMERAMGSIKEMSRKGA